MGLKPKVGVKDVIGVIPKMATTFFCTFGALKKFSYSHYTSKAL